jgi:L-lactate permease
MSAILALAGPFIPYIVAGLVALVGGGGFLWNAKRKAKNEGIAQQQAKEADANAQDIAIIQRATGARPAGGVQSDPNNRDNAKG